MNKKAKRAALVSALSSTVAEGKLVVVDQIVATEYKTKTMAEMLKALRTALPGTALIASGGVKSAEGSLRNRLVVDVDTTAGTVTFLL